MNLKIWLILAGVALAYFLSSITGCQKVPTSPTISIPSQATPAIKLDWNHPDWSDALFGLVNDHFAEFDKAKDAARFCPKYLSLSKTDKIVMWSTLIVAVSKYESGYNPNSVFHEPAPLNVDSIGLLQLSYGDTFCPKSKSQGDLKDPFVNLNCGVKIMAKWINQDGVVQNSDKRGAARYWSVLRDGHHVKDIAAKVSSLGVCKL